MARHLLPCLVALVIVSPAHAQSTEPVNVGVASPGAGAPTVSIPRVEAEATVDGQLDEAAWQQAARLVDFSQFRPVDSRPAEEQSEVLIWYSPSALYLGIRAYDREPGTIRATIAERDRLDREDTVTIYLDTFLDRRRAFFFGVNPLGSQRDGVYSEGQFNPGEMMGGSTDLNPDYLWDSKGRLTDEGYIVEVRIPFKSLRYPASDTQRWGVNILRKVQRTGYEDTWTDTKREASFLAQAGTIEGLHDLKRGVVTELQPFVTATAAGTRTEDGFDRERVEPSAGANLRFGFTNTSIDATIYPDFSQVESDVGLVTVNERFALFYPEKRPFFLEGIELFATPNQLVYTRQVVDPIAGGKLTGKFGRLGVAYLSAVDDTPGDNAWFNIARLRTDFGANSVAGVTFTDRSLPGQDNTVLAADARYVFAKLYYVQGQVGGSRTELNDDTVAAPIWMGEFDRTGRQWGFNYKLTGIGDGFEARSGFVPRNGIVTGRAFNRLTAYGARGAAIESFSVFFGPTRLWRYDDFGGAPIEGEDEVNVSVQARGGWLASGTVRREFYVLNPEQYDGLFFGVPGVALVPYDAPDRQDNLWGLGAGIKTPTWQKINASAEVNRGATVIFDEGSRGLQTRVGGAISMRPTNEIRIELSTTFAELMRDVDGSEFARTLLPRAKVEYQPRRSLFFRVVGEYRDERVSALYHAVNGLPLLDEDGIPIAASRTSALRVDFLVSYEPSPGTVAYVGYGASFDTPDETRRSSLERANDGFFVKLAYLFRK